MVSTLQGRWLNLAATVMLVALAAGPAGAIFHGHQAGAPDDHCAVCHPHHVSAIETPQASLGFESVSHQLSPDKSEAERHGCPGIRLGRGPPLPTTV